MQEGTSEARMDIGVRKIGSLGNKIRIRLPPRKRLSEGVQIMSTGVPEDTKNYPAKEGVQIMSTGVPEDTKNYPAKEGVQIMSTGVPEDTKNYPAKEGVQILSAGVPEDTKNYHAKEGDQIMSTGVPEDTKNYPAKEGVQILSTGVPEDTKNYPAKEVPEHTDNNTESTTFVYTKLKMEEVSAKAQGEGHYEEANSNRLCKTISKDRICEDHLITATGVQDQTESSYPVRKGPCEGGNKNIVSNGPPPPEESSNTPKKESCVGVINKSPSKKIPIARVQDEVEKKSSIMKPCEGASKNILNKSLLHETNSNTSTKGVTEEAEMNNPSKNLKIAANCEEENGNSVENNLFEEDKKNIAGMELSTKSVICAPKKRRADPGYDMKSSKKLCTSAVQATETRQNTSGMKLSTSVGLAVEQSTSPAFLEGAKVYKEFEDKVKRTIYLDSLSVQATDAVIKTALNQFGNVRNVNFLTNYTVPFDIPQSALVEMETEQEAESVVNMLAEFPFMIAGMPRPVSAKRATVEMFSDRPWKPCRKLQFRWVRPTDPDYHDIRKFKLMCKRHEVENLALIKNQLQQEALLAKHQQENLNCQYSKLDSMDSIILNGWVGQLIRTYNLSFDEVYRKSQAFMAPF